MQWDAKKKVNYKKFYEVFCCCIQGRNYYKEFYEVVGKRLKVGVHEVDAAHYHSYKKFYELFGECLKLGVHEGGGQRHINHEKFCEQFGSCLMLGVQVGQEHQLLKISTQEKADYKLFYEKFGKCLMLGVHEMLSQAGAELRAMKELPSPSIQESKLLEPRWQPQTSACDSVAAKGGPALAAAATAAAAAAAAG